LSGGLPDLLSPHLSLGSRYDSFAHSIWFLLIMLSAAFGAAHRLKRFRGIIFFCFFAVLLHLVCDAVSGGINLFAPYKKMIVGSNYVHTRFWIPLDITSLLLCGVLYLPKKFPAPLRSFVFAGGLALAMCVAAFVFIRLDSETFFLKRIPASEINLAQLETAQRAFNNLFSKWQAGTFEPVPGEFNKQMQELMTPQWQESYFRQISNGFGDYRQISLVEVVTTRFNYPHLLLYRFKGSFSGSPEQPEIGIYFDSNNTISGFRWLNRFGNRIMD